jgi:hypothetical protein
VKPILSIYSIYDESKKSFTAPGCDEEVGHMYYSNGT